MVRRDVVVAADPGQHGLEPRVVLVGAVAVFEIIAARDESVDLVGFVPSVNKGLPSKVEVGVDLYLSSANREDAKALGEVSLRVESAQRG